MRGIIITGKLEIEITNIVATASLGGTVDLLQFYESETVFMIYQVFNEV